MEERKQFLALIKQFCGKAQFAVLWAVYDVDHTFFTEELPKTMDAIQSIHLFSSREAFDSYIWAAFENPEDMWYWAVDLQEAEPVVITSGDCNWDLDLDIFRDYFGEDFLQDFAPGVTMVEAFVKKQEATQ